MKLNKNLQFIFKPIYWSHFTGKYDENLDILVNKLLDTNAKISVENHILKIGELTLWYASTHNFRLYIVNEVKLNDLTDYRPSVLTIQRLVRTLKEQKIGKGYLSDKGQEHINDLLNKLENEKGK